MKLILCLILLCVFPVVAYSQARTADTLLDSTFSNLDNLAPRDGSIRHCINCKRLNGPCEAASVGDTNIGSDAVKLNGAWYCNARASGVGTGNVSGANGSLVGELPLFDSTTGRSIGRSNTFSGIAFLTSGVLSTLNSTGTGDVVRDTGAILTNSVLTTPSILSFVNAQHQHSSATQGGQLNASNIFSGGIVPPARLISGTIINSKCLRVNNVGQIEVAANDCGTGSGGSPGGVSGNLTFNESGAFGGIANSTYDSVTGRLTLNQKVNGSDTLFSLRLTDTSPTGSFLRLRNAANTTDLFSVNADASVFFSSTLMSKNIAAPATPAAGSTVLWSDITDKNLKAQDDGGNVSITLRPTTCSGTDKISAISSAGVVTCTADQGGSGTGVITLNTLNTSDQSFAKVDDTNVTLTISSVTSTHTFTLGWTGTLAKARQNSNTVYADQANTWTTGAQSFALVPSLALPSSTGATPSASGLIAYDLTSHTLEYGENGTNRIVANTAGSQTFSNKTLDNSTTASLKDTLLTLQDNVDSTKTVNFELSGITSGTNRVVTIANGPSVTVQPTTLTANQFVTHIDSAGVVQKAQPSFANLSGSMGPTQGGTGLTTVAQGDLLYGDAPNSWARLPKDINATRVLTNTGASNGPAWAQLNLTNGVSGILPSANGGTNSAFFAVSGPAATVKTFTFPDANATVLTDNAAVSIAQGGTGQATQTAAFNALDPLTTKGDLLSHDGTNSVRVAVGTNGQVLQADSTQIAGVKWATMSAAAGGSTTQLQRNITGALGGISGATSDGTDVTFGAGNIVIGNVVLASAPTPSLGRFYVQTDNGKLYFGINGTNWGEVFVSGLSTVNLASANVTGTLPLANGGTNQTTWTAARCVRVNAGGTALEAAAADCGSGGGSGTVTVVASGSLTSTALVTGGGTTTLQTPSATSTLDSSGNMSLPGSLTLIATGAGYLEIAEGTAPTAVANRVTVAAPVDVTAAGWVMSLPTTAGTTGQFLQTNGSGVTTWATPGGSGTVTATGGALTANSVVLGAGTTDTKVVAGIVTDGISKLTLGVAGTSVGSIDFTNVTSGTITLSPVTGALGAVTLTLPARSATVATTTGTLTSGRCVEIDASGNFIQAAAACGSGGGSGTVSTATVTQVAFYTGTTTVSGDAGMLYDSATDSLSVGGTGTFGVVSVNGTGAGYLELAEGTAPTLVANRFQIFSPVDVAAGGLSFILPAAGATGFLKTTNSSGAMTLSIDTTSYAPLVSPSFTTPVLGVATATSINGLTITTTTGTLTIPNGVTVTGPAASDTLVGRASTDTLTNKTYDTAGTGNIFTSTHKVYLAAAGCQNTTASSFFDLPASTPAVAACITGTNTQVGALDFADTAGGFSAQTTLQLPSDFTGTVDARIIWSTTATTGNAKWSLSTICTAVDATETDDAAFNTASTVTTAAPGVANRLQTSSVTSVTITGCAANETMHVKIFRDGADAADTIAATARLRGIELTLTRAQ